VILYVFDHLRIDDQVEGTAVVGGGVEGALRHLVSVGATDLDGAVGELGAECRPTAPIRLVEQLSDPAADVENPVRLPIALEVVEELLTASPGDGRPVLGVAGVTLVMGDELRQRRYARAEDEVAGGAAGERHAPVVRQHTQIGRSAARTTRPDRGRLGW